MFVLSVVLLCGCTNATAQPAATGKSTPEVVAAQNVEPNMPKATRPGHDWSEFLGPHGTGISDEKALLAKWPVDRPPSPVEARPG